MRLVVFGLGSIIPVVFLLGIDAGRAANPKANELEYSPYVAKASDEAMKAIKGFHVPEGMKASLFAAEPLLANPVAICFDEKGRCYVAETFRLHRGVTDDREHMDWLDDDLASRTVADRVALYKKHLKDKFPTYETEHDRVRYIEATKDDGVAQRSTVFADGFHTAAEGLGSGVLARKGNVYYTDIPNLWLLRDTKGTGKADFREVLSTGYGVRVSFLGHDLHGLRLGPDGKLYFSIGDRGLNVKNKEGKTLFNPDSGAVLRCDPNGANLEIVATGLRNPQKLAFDEYGNLFTGDNNSDSGDKARCVYIVDGGDSGWRMGYQYGTAMSDRGPFNAEKIWHPQHEGQPAYIVPPIENVADGPSGFCYYPGTGLSKRYDGHFFLCDFRGAAGNSGVRSFALKPKGASFEMVDQHEFIWSILATDCEFGPDGGFYISDWVDGWELTGKGRIYRFTDVKEGHTPIVAEVKKLLAEGFDQRPNKELAGLLAHRDMRIRQEAQFALADRGDQAIQTLTSVVKDSKNELPRLHAIWGLGQIGRKSSKALEILPSLLADGDMHVRAQAAKIIGEDHYDASKADLVALLKDPEPRVRFFATISLGKLGPKDHVKAIIDMLRDNANKDVYLRHAAVMALTAIKDQEILLGLAQDDSPAVRMAVLLALRRQESPEIARFLDDADPSLVLEAARAIYDVPINGAMTKLASLIKRPGLADHLLFRVLNANFRQGTSENAKAIASIAAQTSVPEALRVEAIQELRDWAKPKGRDRVMGLWRPIEPRSTQPAAEAVRAHLGGLFTGSSRVRQEAAKTAANLGIKEVGPALLEMLKDAKSTSEAKVETLRALEILKDAGITNAVELALVDGEPNVRNEARRILWNKDAKKALASLQKALAEGPTAEKQGAIALLADIKGQEVDDLLTRWLDKLIANQVPPELHLDLIAAASKRDSTTIKEKLKNWEQHRPKNDPLSEYRETLMGGDADAGRRIFFYKSEVTCLKCHKVNGEGGEVGPEMKGIGSKQNREYLLESIVYPNKQIAKGYETVVITTSRGVSISGILKAEDDKEVKLMTAEGKLITVPKSQIDERTTGKSAMPEDVIKHLSKAELRDLVEFLASLK
jgi:quinoprotein glucose dehydrogenase